MVTFLKTIELPGWTGLKVSGRIDAFNDRQMINALEQNIQNSSRVALDLSDAEFLSLQFLKFMGNLHRELGRNGGELALVRPSHNVRRQMEIFLGPKAFNLYQSPQDLQAGNSVQPRSEFHSGAPEFQVL
jgi:anti-anti-sigma regulatory factor